MSAGVTGCGNGIPARPGEGAVCHRNLRDGYVCLGSARLWSLAPATKRKNHEPHKHGIGVKPEFFSCVSCVNCVDWAVLRPATPYGLDPLMPSTQRPKRNMCANYK